eukprot:1161265-Pelagomonas_calceolata.AAC.3
MVDANAFVWHAFMRRAAKTGLHTNKQGEAQEANTQCLGDGCRAHREQGQRSWHARAQTKLHTQKAKRSSDAYIESRERAAGMHMPKQRCTRRKRRGAQMDTLRAGTAQLACTCSTKMHTCRNLSKIRSTHSCTQEEKSQAREASKSRQSQAKQATPPSFSNKCILGASWALSEPL